MKNDGVMVGTPVFGVLWPTAVMDLAWVALSAQISSCAMYALLTAPDRADRWNVAVHRPPGAKLARFVPFWFTHAVDELSLINGKYGSLAS